MTDLSKIPTEELLRMHSEAKAVEAKPKAGLGVQTPDLSKMSTEALLEMRNIALGKERPKMEAGSAFGHGTMQGLSLGWADEGAAAMGAVKDWGAGKLGLRGQIDIDDAYDSYIPHIRAETIDKPLADQKGAFITGNVVGGVAAAAVPGLGVSNAGKGFVAGLKSMGKAATLGGVAGAGTSEHDLTKSPEELKAFGKDVLYGAAVGGVLQGAANVAGKVISKLSPEELTKTANLKAVKAAGAIGSDLKKMGPERVQEVGAELLASKAVRPGSSIEDVMTATAAAKEKAGNAIGEALDSVDNLVKEAHGMIDAGKIGGNLPPQGRQALKDAVTKKFQFNMNRIGDRIEKELIAPNAKNPLLKGESAKLQAIAEDFRANGSVSMREGNVIKGTQGKVTNFNSETVPQAFKKELYGIIKTELDDIVAQTGNLEQAVAMGKGNALGGGGDAAARNQQVSKAYTDAKKAYGVNKEVNDLSTARLGQTQGNREISLTDTIAGAGALATGGAPAAIAVGGLNKLFRTYGDSVLAVGAKKAAEILEAAPLKMGKFANVLESAAKNGAPALNEAHISLMKDPDYRRILDNYERSRAMARRASGS